MFKQLIIPLIASQAMASYCLQYVDDSLSVKQETRTANAQIAHDQAKAKNWVHEDQNFPKNLWFVMFWSIDNGDYAGLGHIALAFVDNDGNMQIHDSEVHRGAREVYTSLDELYNWFGSVGIQMTYLGWGEGVDGVKILEKVEPVAQPKPEKLENVEPKVKTDKAKKRKKELWKVYAFPFSFRKDTSLNKNIYYRID